MNKSATDEQVQKVQERLPGWANKPWQINARILVAFLTLKMRGKNPIYVKDIEEKYLKTNKGNNTFMANFRDMANYSEHNHGKVFDMTSDRKVNISDREVTIWPLVADLVREFEAQIRGTR